MDAFRFLLCYFLLISSSVNCGDSPQRDKFIRGVRSRLTTYISVAQDKQVCQKVEDQMWANKTGEQIMSGFVGTVLGIFTFGQTMDIASKGLKCSSDTGLSLTDLLSKLGTALSANLTPVLNQIVGLIANLRSKKGMQRDPVTVISYRKMNQFITPTRMNTIVCRVVAQFTPAQWVGVRKNFGTLLLLSQYPCAMA